MDPLDIRKHNLLVTKAMGYPTNPSLPLLDVPQTCRAVDCVVDRVLGMHCLAACAYGFDRNRASGWLQREVKGWALTSDEECFLREGSGDRQQFMRQIEGMWALSWYIGCVEELAFDRPCSSTFVKMLPDLRRDESATEFRLKAVPRPVEQLLRACDLAYCLHWAVRDSRMRNQPKPGQVNPYVIVERRHALDWAMGTGDWDEVVLDT